MSTASPLFPRLSATNSPTSSTPREPRGYQRASSCVTRRHFRGLSGFRHLLECGQAPTFAPWAWLPSATPSASTETSSCHWPTAAPTSPVRYSILNQCPPASRETRSPCCSPCPPSISLSCLPPVTAPRGCRASGTSCGVEPRSGQIFYGRSTRIWTSPPPTSMERRKPSSRSTTTPRVMNPPGCGPALSRRFALSSSEGGR